MNLKVDMSSGRDAGADMEELTRLIAESNAAIEKAIIARDAIAAKAQNIVRGRIYYDKADASIPAVAMREVRRQWDASAAGLSKLVMLPNGYFVPGVVNYGIEKDGNGRELLHLLIDMDDYSSKAR